MRWIVPLLLLAAPVLADSVVAYGERNWRSPGGAFVLKTTEKKGGGIDFVIKSAKGRKRGSGTLDHMPIDVAVFEDGTGFVFWGRYLREARGIAVARYDFDGTLRWKHEYKALFDEDQRKGFPSTLSFVFWARAIWIDPAKSIAVGLTQTRIVKVFNLRTGAIKPGGMDALLDSLNLPAPPRSAIEAAGAWFPERARDPLLAIAANQKMALDVRVAAAGAAQRKGDYLPLLEAALDDKIAAPHAVRVAAIVLPADKAIEFLEQAALRKGVGVAAVTELAKLRATKALIDVVAHGDTPPAARKAASALLRNMPKAEVRGGLLKEFGDADLDTAIVMLDAMIGVGGKNLPGMLQPHQQKLVQLLDRKGADVPWLAMCFTRYPTTEAVPALLRAARKYRGKRKESKQIFDALRACTGLKLGNSLTDWERALRGR